MRSNPYKETPTQFIGRWVRLLETWNEVNESSEGVIVDITRLRTGKGPVGEDHRCPWIAAIDFLGTGKVMWINLYWIDGTNYVRNGSDGPRLTLLFGICGNCESPLRENRNDYLCTACRVDGAG